MVEEVERQDDAVFIHRLDSSDQKLTNEGLENDHTKLDSREGRSVARVDCALTNAQNIVYFNAKSNIFNNLVLNGQSSAEKSIVQKWKRARTLFANFWFTWK